MKEQVIYISKVTEPTYFPALIKDKCEPCGGSGLLGFQRESCWFCNGNGYVMKELRG